MRGVPDWLEALRGQPEPRVASARHDQAAAARTSATSTTSSTPPASPRRSTTASPARDDRRQHQRLAQPAGVRPAQRQDGPAGARASSSTRPARSTATPTPDSIPTPETYRGNVSCTGPRACYDESKRYGETLCVIFASSTAMPVTMARPFNNYGPGPEDHRPPRHPRLRPRHPRRPRHRHALRRLADAHVLLRGGRDRRLLQGAGARHARRGVQHRHRAAGDLDRASWPSCVDHGPRAVRLRRQGRAQAQRTRRTTWSTTPTAAAPIITKARTELGYRPEDLTSTRASAAR